MHTLTLLVGNVFTPDMAESDGRYAATESFLSRCSIVNSGRSSVTAWTCNAFGVARDHDWPVGAILAYAHGSNRDCLVAGVSSQTEKHWICIDPVHLAVDRDSLVLQPRSRLRLQESESSALFASLAAHFAAEDFCMLQIGAGRWCLGTTRPTNMNTTEVELAEGCNVNDILPSGADAAIWQRYTTEAQMVLHEHPVNIAREARGEPVVNSLWLWGVGAACPAIFSPFSRIVAEDVLLRSLARLSGTSLTRPPGSSSQLNAGGRELAEFLPDRYADQEQVLAALEAQWIAPAWQSLNSGSLDKFSLIVQLSGLLFECSCDGRARRRFWKRRRPLSASLAKLREAA